MARSRPPSEHPSLPEPEGSGGLQEVQWDPQAPRPARARAQAATNQFQNVPEELFAAHGKLLAQLGGATGLAQAQALATRSDRFGQENLGAVYIGKKVENAGPTGRLCIKVQVKKKVTDTTRIDSSFLIPPVIKEGNREWPTDVEQMGDIKARSGFQDVEMPARGGSSIGLNIPNKATGTFGALVVLVEGQLCILSNNHVLADVNSAPSGAQVYQPGLVDADSQDAKNANVIGTLLRFVPLILSSGSAGGAAPSSVDAAVAWTNRRVASPEHHNFVIKRDPAAGGLNMAVKKEGRTTGYTEGQIIGVHATVPVAYDRSDGAHFVAVFNGQLVIEGFNQAFSDHGDSGSVIVDQSSDQVVGLLFSGGKDPATGRDLTYANPIADVMDAIGIDHFAS